MAMELPVITSNVGAVPEIVVDGETGYLIQPGDSNAFVERLRALIDSPSTRARMGSAGRSLAVGEFSLKRNVPRFIELLEH